MTFVVRNLANKQALKKIFILISLVAFSAIVALPLHPGMPASGLDASWISAMNQGVADHKVFGSDIVFTYGPLASVVTKAYHPATFALTMGGSIIILFGAVLGFWHLANKSLIRFASLPIVLVMAGVSDSYFMMLPLLLLFCAAQVNARPSSKINYLPFIALGISCGLLPLIKGSLSGVVLPLSLLSCVILCTHKHYKLTVFTLGSIVLSLVSGWAISGQPILGLPTFFIAQVPIISGYAGAMSLAGPHWPINTAILLAACLWFLISYWSMAGGAKLFVPLSLGLAAYFFISIKAAFVRHDGHAILASWMFIYSGAVLFTATPKGLAVLCMILSIIGWTSIQNSVTQNLYGGIETASANISESFSAAQLLIKGRSFREEFESSNSIIRQTSPFKPIGSVDVYPTELAPIFAYGATWSGRPIPQSYSAYTKSLLVENANFLLTNKAPETIYFTIAAIDSRLPSQDDSLSWPILLSNYKISEMQGGYAVMRRSRTSTYRFDNKRFLTVTSKEVLSLPQSGSLLWVTIDIQPSLLGKAMLAAYKLPDTTIRLTLTNGRIVTHRIIPDIVRQGFLLSPYVGTTNDFVRVSAGTAEDLKVESFQVITHKPFLWKKGIKISLQDLHIEPQPKAMQLITISPSESHFIESDSLSDCSIDGASSMSNGLIQINGWASPNARKGISPESIQIRVMKGSEASFYALPVQQRPDVGIFFNHPDMKMVGFNALLDTHLHAPDANITIYAIKGNKRFKCQNTLNTRFR